MSGDRIAGFRDRIFDRTPDVMTVTSGDCLHHVIDSQLRSHLTSAVSANAICQDREQYRRPVALIEHERRHSITVLIILARHTGMRLSIDIQVSADNTYHADFFEMIFGSDSAGGWFRSKRYINCPKLILSPCIRRRPSRVTGSKLTHVPATE